MKVVVIVLFVSLCACSHYVRLIEPKSEFQMIQTRKLPPYCSETRPFQIVQSGPLESDNFLRHVGAIEKKHKLSFFDKAALLTLYQVLVRPDASNHFSRLQIVYGDGKTVKYRDYYPATKKMEEVNFLHGLNSFLKENGNARDVFQLAKIADQNFAQNVPATRGLRAFIQKNKNLLKRDAYLKERFFRLESELQEGETLKAFSLSKFASKLRSVRRSLSSPKTETPNFFSWQVEKEDQSFQILCNQNLARYHDPSFAIDGGADISTNAFGMYQKKGRFFFAITRSSLDQALPLSQENSYSLRGRAPKAPAWVCLNQKKGDWKTVWMSLSGRDPGQLLFHLLQKHPGPSGKFEDLEKLIGAARHQVLVGPKRLLFERNRASESQLEELFKHGLPVYYAPEQGEVWGLWKSTEGEQRLMTDDRHPAHQTCQD